MEQIMELENKTVDAFNAGNVAEILKYFDEELIGFSSTQHERLEGLDALRKTFEYYLKEAPKLEYHISEPSVKLFGETAIMTFYWKVALIHDAKRTEIDGRGSHVFVKRNGEWKIIHEHFSRAHRH